MQSPRLGFAGVGWIGLARLRSIVEHDAAAVAVIFDPNPQCVERALELVPHAQTAKSFDELLKYGLDGLVIATPNCVHAEQTIAALDNGFAVFCQKPLGLTASEVRTIVDLARWHNRLLGVDYSYRYTAGISAIRDLLLSRQLGDVFAAELIFHNAYGPDREWYYDPHRAGGGCVIDLGVHLIDLILWLLDYPDVTALTTELSHNGKLRCRNVAEDYAAVQIVFNDHIVVRLACSWRLQTARDANISVCLYGTKGGVEFHNVNGSFYDFSATYFTAGKATLLSSPPDDWSGRAILKWIKRLEETPIYDSENEHFESVANIIDRIYER